MFTKDLSDTGHIAGEGVGIRARPFLYSPGLGYADFGTLGGPFSNSWANAVNNAGEAVGVSEVDGGTRAFIFSRVLGLKDLGQLPGVVPNQTEARSINNLGQITGHSGYVPFVYSAGTGMVPIPGLAGGIGQSINDRGQVAGHASDGQSDFRAFLYTPEKGVELLPWKDSVAEAVNNRGQIIGQYYDWSQQDFVQHFYYSPETGMVDINDVLDPVSGKGWVIDRAYDINDRGYVAAVATFSDGSQRAVLLTPVPEPQTLALMALGAIVVGASVRRRRTTAAH